MPRPRKEKKASYFDGIDYRGCKVRTKLIFEGVKEYKPMKFEKSQDVYKEFKG